MSRDCLKLTTYTGERVRDGDALFADALLDLYEGNRIEVSATFRGIEGFGAKQHLRSDRLLSLSEDLPLVAVAVDQRDRIENLLDDVRALGRQGMSTLERARLLTGEEDRAPEPGPLSGETKLTIYVGRQDRIAGEPAFIGLSRMLRDHGLAGATTLLGIDGTVRGRRERARFLSRNRNVPMMVIAAGPGREIGRVLPEIEQLACRPVITIERITVCKRDGKLISPPPSLRDSDEQGRPVWQKLMVYTSEAALHEGRPIHAELIHRLRSSGAFGATSLRGVWGFHGDHAPHGDRALQLRRNVPVVSVIIDRPSRIAESFETIDPLTAERGLVTCETVPAVTELSEVRRPEVDG